MGSLLLTFWRRKWQATPVFLPGKSHGQRSLVGYSSWGCTQSDMIEQLNTLLTFLALSKQKVLFLARGGERLKVGMKWGFHISLHEVREDFKYWNEFPMVYPGRSQVKHLGQHPAPCRQLVNLDEWQLGFGGWEEQIQMCVGTVKAWAVYPPYPIPALAQRRKGWQNRRW